MSAPPSEPISRLQPVMLAGAAGPIEGLLQEHDPHDHTLVAVICHPHPLFGGTLHNKVVHRLASTLHGMGAAVLRFNFRGVGKSAGTHDRGTGELDDARLALGWIADRYPGARRWVGGFSFGSWVASRLAASESAVERLILVAPPVHTQTFEEMQTCPTPKLVIQGTADDICKPENLDRVFPTWAEPKRLMKVEGASHFFDKHLAALADAVLEGLR
jgi:alpha/beta superfamily hydrolase